MSHLSRGLSTHTDIEAHAHELFAQSLRLAGTLRRHMNCSEQEAGEAALYAFGELWQRLRERPGSVDKPASWMYTAARNFLFRSREKAHREVPTEDERLHSMVGPEWPQHAVERQESDRWAVGLVSRLPAGERAAVQLRHFADLTTAEIAEELQITEEAVRARLSRGHRNLKKILKEEGG